MFRGMVFNKYRQALASAALCMLLALPTTAALASTPQSELSQGSSSKTNVPLHPGFAAFFQQKLQEDDVPGGVFAVVHQDRVVAVQPFGVRHIANPEPVTEDTVFRIASVSKTFAAGLAAVIEHQGLFSWEDPVLNFVPDFSFKNPDLNQLVKVEHLLAQSTGVIPNAYDNLIEASYDRERIIPHFSSLNPMCTPGACYGYQNVLFSFIEPVLEQTTGKPYSELLQEYILDPLQLEHASVGIEGYLLADNRAAPHVKGRNGWFSREVTEHYYRFASAAGINASAVDLSRWLIAQMGYADEVLPHEVLAELRQKRVRTVRDLRRRHWRNYLTDAHYGLGWRLYQMGQHELVFHGGWVQGFRSEIAYSPEFEVGLVVLLNAESSVLNELTAEFWNYTLTRMEEEQWVPYYHASRVKSWMDEPSEQRSAYSGSSSADMGLLYQNP